MAELDLETARRRKQNAQSEYTRIQSEITNFKDKIQRLEPVKKALKNIKEEANSLKKDASKKRSTSDLNIDWKGQKYDDYISMIEDNVKIDFVRYIDGIDDCLDHVVDKINEYENEIIKKRTILSGLWTTINNMTGWIEKLTN